MLALDFVKANRETVERAIRDKGVDLDLSALFSLDAEVRAAKTEIERRRRSSKDGGRAKTEVEHRVDGQYLDVRQSDVDPSLAVRSLP